MYTKYAIFHKIFGRHPFLQEHVIEEVCGFFLVCEDYGGTLNKSFTACAFFFFKRRSAVVKEEFLFISAVFVVVVVVLLSGTSPGQCSALLPL